MHPISYKESLNGEIFYTLCEAQVLIEAWRRHYNTIRLRSALGYRLPAPEIVLPQRPAPAAANDALWPSRAFRQCANGLTLGMVQTYGSGQRATCVNEVQGIASPEIHGRIG